MLAMIAREDRLLGVHVSTIAAPEGVRFVTPKSSFMQVATIKRPAGETVRAHRHPAHTRVVYGTPETLLVVSGKMTAYVFDEDDSLVWSDVVRAGEALVLLRGGHELVFLEDTTVLEVKQGPYLGVQDKVYIDPEAQVSG
jgi:hypothetical protein